MGYWTVFGIDNPGPATGLAGILVLLHWAGLGSALRAIAKSAGLALLVTFAAPVTGGFVILVVWFHWGWDAALFPLIVALAFMTVAGAVLLEAPTGIAATPGPTRVKKQPWPNVAALLAALVIAMSMFFWVWVLLDLVFWTSPELS